MKRNYECMLLLDNREVRQGWQRLKDVVAAMFTKHGGQILSSRRWDERRLAYPILRHQRGTYLLVYFAAETSSLAALRREIELSETVLRHVIRTCDEVPETAYEPEVEFDETAIRDEGPKPVPEQARADDDEGADDSDANDDDDDAETVKVGGDDDDETAETAAGDER